MSSWAIVAVIAIVVWGLVQLAKARAGITTDAEGNEIHTDFERMMKIVLDHGYHGYVGIEFEGGKLSEFEGVKKTKALLQRVAAKLA